MSSFLALNWFLQVITFTFNAILPFPTEDEAITFPEETICLLALYGASNCLFFLNPCLRAAAITESREILIYKVNKESVSMSNISPELKDQFDSHLKNQNFGFKLQFLCAKVSFGLNVAYLAILVSLFGLLLKISNTV